MKKKRPPHLKNIRELKRPEGFCYPGSREKMSRGVRLSNHGGLQRLGIWHEIVSPGERTSWPHAHSKEEEFVYVLKGRPQLWLDGEIFPLTPGDAIGIPAGTGQAHVFLNNSKKKVELLVVGEVNIPGDKIFYPMHPARNQEMKEKGFFWKVPGYKLKGQHDGMTDRRRKSKIR